MDNLGVTFKSAAERIEFMRDRRENHATLQKIINTPDVREAIPKKTIEEKVILANFKRQWRKSVKQKSN